MNTPDYTPHIVKAEFCTSGPQRIGGHLRRQSWSCDAWTRPTRESPMAVLYWTILFIYIPSENENSPTKPYTGNRHISIIFYL